MNSVDSLSTVRRAAGDGLFMSAFIHVPLGARGTERYCSADLEDPNWGKARKELAPDSLRCFDTFPDRILMPAFGPASIAA
jgi:hypothetical protein